MFRLVGRSALLHGKRPGKAPTITVGGVSMAATAEGGAAKPRPERIVRPLTDEEENYELTRMKKNAGSNLRLKGKQGINVGRRASEKRYEHYDQI
jgi:hypothetical protein